MELTINYLAVLVSGISAVVIGFLWYGPVFGKVWMKEVGYTDADATAARNDPAKMNAMYRSYALTALAGLAMAFILAHFISMAPLVLGMTGLSGGMAVAAMAWIGFIVPISLNSVLWEGKSSKYWLVVAGYYLFTLLVMSTILSLWT